MPSYTVSNSKYHTHSNELQMFSPLTAKRNLHQIGSCTICTLIPTAIFTSASTLRQTLQKTYHTAANLITQPYPKQKGKRKEKKKKKKNRKSMRKQQRQPETVNQSLIFSKKKSDREKATAYTSRTPLEKEKEKTPPPPHQTMHPPAKSRSLTRGSTAFWGNICIIHHSPSSKSGKQTPGHDPDRS